MKYRIEGCQGLSNRQRKHILARTSSKIIETLFCNYTIVHVVVFLNDELNGSITCHPTTSVEFLLLRAPTQQSLYVYHAKCLV